MSAPSLVESACTHTAGLWPLLQALVFAVLATGFTLLLAGDVDL